MREFDSVIIGSGQAAPSLAVGLARRGETVALVEGSTEVLLDISEFSSTQVPLRTFSVHWVNGGPGVVKGVESLPGDMQAALVAGLQSRGAAN